MTEESLRYVTEILKGHQSSTEADWYEVSGFLVCHKIAGLFYHRAQTAMVSLPGKAEWNLREVFCKQQRRAEFMRLQIKEISDALLRANAEHAFLKGSVMCNVPFANRLLYIDGERTSNDIDLLVKPTGITAVSNVLKDMGFVQGRYDAKEKKIIPFSRAEILMRRMNRGEVAPFVRQTENAEIPFTEVDLNFSLGNTPNADEELLCDMIDSSTVQSGKVPMKTLVPELFFLHLVMHQYKESCLHFMVARNKDLELYKLADMYYLIATHAFNQTAVQTFVRKYRLEEPFGAVLHQVGEIFDDDEIRLWAKEYICHQPQVIDYDTRKRYVWTASVRERVKAFSTECYLKEAVLHAE
ncbi:MAG: nucleotidyltransferase family protein [Clostridiales bacterium]|nr:nucleotidyltransferase family protein [Clostridiales bacterium]